MIELPVVWIILIPMGCKLAGIFLFWMYYRLHKSNNPAPKEPNIFRCRECEYVYVDERRVPLSTCGRCGAFNESVRR